MTHKRTKILVLGLITAASLFFFLEKAFLPGLSTRLSPENSLKILGKVMYLIKNDYVEEPDPASIMRGAFQGLADSLDPLSSYLNSASWAKLNQEKEGGLREIGLVLYKTYGAFPVVVGVKENSPAEKNGIKAGEYISALDGQSTLAMSMLEANLALKDMSEAPVRVKLLRTSKNVEISIERALLAEGSYSFSVAEGTGGILRIHNLYPGCTEAIVKHILPGLKNLRKPLILDLRNCYEGDFEEARKLINLFLKSEKLGYFEKKGGTAEAFFCPDKAELAHLPLVVWTNRATIGPAEVVAGVLKEYKKARIIGFPTPGLAAKQSYLPLDDQSGLLLTTSIFSINQKKKLWKTGVKPDAQIGPEDQSPASYLDKTRKILSKT